MGSVTARKSSRNSGIPTSEPRSWRCRGGASASRSTDTCFALGRSAVWASSAAPQGAYTTCGSAELAEGNEAMRRRPRRRQALRTKESRRSIAISARSVIRAVMVSAEKPVVGELGHLGSAGQGAA